MYIGFHDPFSKLCIVVLIIVILFGEEYSFPIILSFIIIIIIVYDGLIADIIHYRLETENTRLSAELSSMQKEFDGMKFVEFTATLTTVD